MPNYQVSECSEDRTNICIENQKQSNDTYSIDAQAKKSRKKPITEDAIYKKEVVHEIKNIIENQFGPVIASLMCSIENSERRLQEKQILEQIQNDWSDVAKVADHFLFYFFPSMTIFTCFIIFFNSPHLFNQW